MKQELLVLDDLALHDLVRHRETPELGQHLLEADVERNNVVSESDDRLLLVVQELNCGPDGGSLVLGAVEVDPEVPGLVFFDLLHFAEEVQSVLDKPGRPVRRGD